MPEGITAENLLSNIMGTLSDSVSKQKSVSFFEEEKPSVVTSQFNRLFGREKPVHHLLGGILLFLFSSMNYLAADVLLWRNKKISSSVLSGATVIWVLFEWLNYHLVTLLCLALVIGMLVQFVWSNASGLQNRCSESRVCSYKFPNCLLSSEIEYYVLRQFLNGNRSPAKVPRLVLPDELFVNIAISIGAELNRALGFLQDVACGGNIKQVLVVVASMWTAAVIGGWCNFLTVLYIGFIAAHTLPVLYERYEDQVDSLVRSLLGQLQHHYQRLDTGVLSRVPSRKFQGKKFE
ncbi:hypothetical protein RJ640_011936 [Escallonia rubra]|uniref:Reticulon-like protein n=1 Tax=Escallonia rubra TaxID=112253 RepID=A0AA88RYL3_9ASTE|nr:hypothetical protein RJ640_011936 [Escallonia rubra]